jgi:predicted dehydrogenase
MRPREPFLTSLEIIPGGSAVYDLGTHLLDQAVHLLGLPARVTGFIAEAQLLVLGADHGRLGGNHSAVGIVQQNGEGVLGTRSSPVAQQSMTLEPTSSIRPCICLAYPHG